MSIQSAANKKGVQTTTDRYGNVTTVNSQTKIPVLKNTNLKDRGYSSSTGSITSNRPTLPTTITTQTSVTPTSNVAQTNQLVQNGNQETTRSWQTLNQGTNANYNIFDVAKNNTNNYSLNIQNPYKNNLSNGVNYSANLGTNKMANVDMQSAVANSSNKIVNDFANKTNKSTNENTSEYQATRDKQMADILSQKGLTIEDFRNINPATRTKMFADLGLNTDDSKYMKEYVARNSSKIQSEELNKFTDEHKVLGSLASIPINSMMSLGNTVEKAIQFANGTPMNTETSMSINSQVAPQMRETASQNLGNVGNFLYGTAMSMGDMGYNALTLGNLAPVGMGTEKASDVMNNASERGLTNNQIMAEGIASGVSTAITEKLPFDAIMKGSGSTIKSIVKAALSEGGQEISEDIVDAIADQLIAKDKSELAIQYATLVSNGVSENEAKKTIALDFVKQAALDGLGGAISGGALAGVGSLGRSTKNVKNPTDYNQNTTETKTNIDQTVANYDNAIADVQNKLDTTNYFEREVSRLQEREAKLAEENKAAERAEKEKAHYEEVTKVTPTKIAEETAKTKEQKALEAEHKAKENEKIKEQNRANIQKALETPSTKKEAIPVVKNGTAHKYQFANFDEQARLRKENQKQVKAIENKQKANALIEELFDENTTQARRDEIQVELGKLSKKITSKSKPVNVDTLFENQNTEQNIPQLKENVEENKTENGTVNVTTNVTENGTLNSETKTVEGKTSIPTDVQKKFEEVAKDNKSYKNYKTALEKYYQTGNLFNVAAAERLAGKNNDSDVKMLLSDIIIEATSDENSPYALQEKYVPNSYDDISVNKPKNEIPSVTETKAETKTETKTETKVPKVEQKLQFFKQTYDIDNQLDEARKNNDNVPKIKKNPAIKDSFGNTIVSQAYTNSVMNSTAYKTNEDIRNELDFEAKSGAYEHERLSNAESQLIAKQNVKDNYDGVVDNLIYEPIRFEYDENGNIVDNSKSAIKIDAAFEIIDNKLDFSKGDDCATCRGIVANIVNSVSDMAQGLQAMKKYAKTESVLHAMVVGERMINDSTDSYYKGGKKKQRKPLTKIAKALADMGTYDPRAKLPNSELTFADYKAQVEEAIGKEAYSIRKNFSDEDIDFLANKCKNGASVKELEQMLTRKVATGFFEISDSDIAKINELYDKAREVGFDSEEGFSYTEEAAEIFASYTKGNLLDTLNTIRYTAMLMAPTTHIRNVSGNLTAKQTLKVAENIAGIIEERARKSGKLSGGSHAFINPLSKNDMALYKAGMSDFMQNSYRDYMANGSKYSEAKAIDNHKPVKMPKLLKKIADGNSTLLEVEDVWTGQKNYADRLARYLKANGKSVDVITSTNPKDIKFMEKAREYALNQANIATYHDVNKATKAATQLSAWASKIPVIDFIFKANFPFLKVPVNVTKMAVTDLNPAYQAYKLATNKRNSATGHFDWEQGSIQIGKAVTSSGLIALGYALKTTGIMTGPSDEEDKGNILKRINAYSIRVGNRDIPIAWLSPIGTVMVVGALLADKGEPVDAVLTIGDAILDASFLSGFNQNVEEAVYAVSNNDDGTNKASQWMRAFAAASVSSYAQQYFSSAGAKLANTISPEVKNSYTVKNEGWKGTVEETVKNIQKKIPVLKDKGIVIGGKTILEPLANSVDKFGNVKTYEGDTIIKRALKNFLDPTNSYKREEWSDVEKEFSRLGKVADERGIKALDGVFSNVSQKVGDTKLSGKDYENYQILVGKTRYSMVDQLIKSEDYINGNDTDKLEMLKDVGNLADNICSKTMGDEVEYYLANKALEKVGTEDYEVIKDMLDTDDVVNVMEAVDAAFKTKWERAEYVAQNYANKVAKDKTSQELIEKVIAEPSNKIKYYNQLYDHLSEKATSKSESETFVAETGLNATKSNKALVEAVGVDSATALHDYAYNEDTNRIDTEKAVEYVTKNNIPKLEAGKLYYNMNGTPSKKAQNAYSVGGYEAVADYYDIEANADTGGSSAIERAEFVAYAKAIKMSEETAKKYWTDVYKWSEKNFNKFWK